MAQTPFIGDSPSTFGDKGDTHKAVGEQPLTPEERLGQKQSEKQKVAHSWKRYEEARNHKWYMVNPGDWKRYALIYGDQHWDGTQEAWQSTPTVNLSFAAINTILPDRKSTRLNSSHSSVSRMPSSA